MDAKTGALLWSDEKTSGPSISGVAAGAGTLFVWKEDRSKNIFGNNILTAFEAATGKQKWERTSATNPGAFAGPMVFSPGVVLSCDYPEGNAGLEDSSGFVYQAFNGATGEKLWSSQTNWKYREAIARGELLIVSAQKVHAVLNENNNVSPDSWVSVISLRTGKDLWRSQEVELGVFTLPAVGDGMVVVGSKPFKFNDVAGKPEVAGLWAWPLSK